MEPRKGRWPYSKPLKRLVDGKITQAQYIKELLRETKKELAAWGSGREWRA